MPPRPADAEVKLTQFADDTTLLLVNDNLNTEAFQIFDLFERASGAKINKYKCKGLWCGGFALRSDQTHGFNRFKDYHSFSVIGRTRL